jgi:hypothetical protein
MHKHIKIHSQSTSLTKQTWQCFAAEPATSRMQASYQRSNEIDDDECYGEIKILDDRLDNIYLYKLHHDKIK